MMNHVRTLWFNAALAIFNTVLLAVLLIDQFNISSAQVDEQYFANNTVRLANKRYTGLGGTANNQGTVTLFDRATDKVSMGIGFYEFGAGIFTPAQFEVWSRGFSVASHNTLPVFQVRNKEDTRAAIWINGEGVIGSQDAPIHFGISRPHQEGWETVGGFNKDGSFSIKGDITMQGESLGQRLAAIEAKLGLKKQ